MIPIKDNSRRYGQFSVSQKMLDEELHIVQAVFKKMSLVVVEATARYQPNSVEYVAISPMFEEVDAAMIAPKYDVITTMEDGDVCVSVKKIEV